MVVLKLGNLDNVERKFIPTKKDELEKYLNTIEKVEEWELIQTYKDGYKYRSYNDGNDIKYTRNNKMDKITEVIEINKDTFDSVLNENNKYIRKVRKMYKDGLFKIDVDCFLEPISMIMVEVSTEKESLDDYEVPKGFIEVTNIQLYQNSDIYKGSIISNNYIIEGTDGVGKTVVATALIKSGIICQDRCTDMISKNMVFDISTEERAKRYQKYLKNIDNKVIILVNNDREELEKRINEREKISEYDKETFRYNQLYLETYLYMKDKNMLENKMFLVDCTGLSIEEQIDKVKQIILNN